MRWPLEVFRAMRAVWPETEKPMSVRISANDWVGEAGVTPEDAVEIARACSRRPGPISSTSVPGRPDTEAKPVYGRMFQTPVQLTASATRQGLATIAVGNITEADQVNGILLGRVGPTL